MQEACWGVLSWISVSTVALCSAALIMILSVFNGFHVLVEGTYRYFYTDLRIAPKQGQFFTLSDSVLRVLSASDNVQSVARVVRTKVFIQSELAQMSCAVLGVDSAYVRMTDLAHLCVRGNPELFTNDAQQMLVGYGVGNVLRASHVGAPLVVYLAPARVRGGNIEEDIRAGNFSVCGAFVSGQADFDNSLCFMNLHDVQKYMGLQAAEASEVYLSLRDRSLGEQTRRDLSRLFPPEQFHLQTYYEQNQELFSVLYTEKWIIVLILGFVMLVASFSITSTLRLCVLEKKHHIRLLSIVGASRKKIATIFLYSGLLLGGAGCVGGIVLGSIVVFLQYYFHLIPINGQHFWVDYFPVRVRAEDYCVVFGLGIVIAILASVHAAKATGKYVRSTHLLEC